MSSNYASNVVRCKLADWVGSTPEAILGASVFEQLSNLYEGWRCWVYSGWEFQTFAACQEPRAQDTFALVSQLDMPGVGRVDFAVFVPQISTVQPLVVLECDGHSYHERTPDQASSDNRRDRALQRLGIPVLRFTATDILRNSDESAREVAQFVDKKLQENATKEAERAASYDNGYQDGYEIGFLLS
jgi:very-short-patch-repair endonuclease